MNTLDVDVQDRSFLLIHDGTAGVTTVRSFDDPMAADAAYVAAEREAGRGSGLDIVLVGAVDLDTVRVTHASYFRGQRVVHV